MPSVEGSISEINFATEKLGALGVKVASNSDGIYLGDEILNPIFEELNRRKSFGISKFNVGRIFSRSERRF